MPMDERDQGSDVPEAFWQQKDETRYELRVTGDKQAVINLASGRGEVFRDDSFHGDEFVVPDYVSVFDEAERRLGLPRIDDVRNADGEPDPELRLSVEQTAELDRAARTPVQWVRGYALRAFDILNRKAVETELSADANDARQELSSAFNEPGEERFADEDKVRAHLEAAGNLLWKVHEVDSDSSAELLMCDKAIATLDYEHASDVLEHAPTEEALRRGALSPELADSPWTAEGTSPSATQEADAEQSDAEIDRRFLPSRAGRASERDRDGEDFGRER